MTVYILVRISEENVFTCDREKEINTEDFTQVFFNCQVNMIYSLIYIEFSPPKTTNLKFISLG